MYPTGKVGVRARLQSGTRKQLGQLANLKAAEGFRAFLKKKYGGSYPTQRKGAQRGE